MNQLKKTEIETELSGFDIYHLLKEKESAFLLDSSNNTVAEGRFSIVALRPYLTVKVIDNVTYVNDKQNDADIFNVLKEILDENVIKNDTQYPLLAGGIGYFSYDLKTGENDIISKHKENNQLPQANFVFHDNYIIIDEKEKKCLITALGTLSDSEEVLNQLVYMVRTCKKHQFNTNKKIRKSVSLKSPFTEETYIKAIEKIRKYIEEGDIYVTNMTHTFQGCTERNGYDIYKTLRYINPAPFSAYLPFEGFEVLCSSPERFVQIKKGVVTTCPIKGTIPRGKDKASNEFNKKQLLMSEKEQSELLMIVDLERNDLSKVCKNFSVKVKELFKVKEFETVYHLTSEIEGQLDRDFNAIDCIKCMFPGGSVTGAPKLRAMEIIDETEKGARGIYTGSIGYFSFNGDADFNIVIRTIIKKNNQVSIGVGGGITWESDPLSEYRETLQKAKVLIEALETEEFG